MRFILTLSLLLACTEASAQVCSGASGCLLPDPLTEYSDLAAFLSLTEAQARALVEIARDRNEAEQALYSEALNKETEMYQLLRSGSTDAGRIGLLMIEATAIRNKLPLTSEPYRTRALEVLTPAQRNALPGLVNALRLQSPAWQATYLNLIDRPAQDIGLGIGTPELKPVGAQAPAKRSSVTYK